jgi:hypothetical protein
MVPYELYDDKNNLYYGYNFNLELPNGDWKTTYHFRPKNNENADKIEIPQQELDTLKIKLEPEPISQEQQRIMDIAEEEENKRKEHEARMA